MEQNLRPERQARAAMILFKTSFENVQTMCSRVLQQKPKQLWGQRRQGNGARRRRTPLRSRRGSGRFSWVHGLGAGLELRCGRRGPAGVPGRQGPGSGSLGVPVPAGRLPPRLPTALARSHCFAPVLSFPPRFLGGGLGFPNHWEGGAGRARGPRGSRQGARGHARVPGGLSLCPKPCQPWLSPEDWGRDRAVAGGRDPLDLAGGRGLPGRCNCKTASRLAGGLPAVG